jgi:hypothetical protein
MTFEQAIKVAEAHEKARTDAIAARLNEMEKDWAARGVYPNKK